jgi:hypothetical protein
MILKYKFRNTWFYEEDKNVYYTTLDLSDINNSNSITPTENAIRAKIEIHGEIFFQYDRKLNNALIVCINNKAYVFNTDDADNEIYLLNENGKTIDTIFKTNG